MSTPAKLQRARRTFDDRAWAEARTRLAELDREHPLELADLERLATAAYLSGHDEESAEAWSRAHQKCLDRDDPERAARCAFWLAFGMLNKGETARGGGWLARARRLLDDGQRDCVELGYLMVPEGLKALAGDDADRAYAIFDRAAEIGRRFREPDLLAMARVGRGQARVRTGAVDEGVALLDETMAAVEAGELSPIVAGTVYCALIETCQDIFDLRRAQEWTAALGRWCESQPELVPYRGQCSVRRAELLQLQGVWTDAMEEARRACEWLTGPPGEPAAGSAFYQRAELHRLRGELERAEEAYRRASEWGREPQPGLALLRLAQGRIEDAAAAIRRALEEGRKPAIRCRLLPAHVEIMLAANDLEEARTAAEELARIAADLDAPFLDALAARAEGAVQLAAGDARTALDALRRARKLWNGLGAPYESARVRVLIGRASRALGDEDTARLELEGARAVFDRLGAEPDSARVEALERPSQPGAPGGLTPREMDVLVRIAAGKTNRSIAEELSISERTVERHVSNLFNKLGVSTRTAAAAYAYSHRLV